MAGKQEVTLQQHTGADSGELSVGSQSTDKLRCMSTFVHVPSTGTYAAASDNAGT